MELLRMLKGFYRFELYERIGGRGGRSDKEYSIRLALSEGAHSSNVLDSALDARHSLNVKQKRYVAVCIIEMKCTKKRLGN